MGKKSLTTQIGEDNERIEAMGQDSEVKAARWVKEDTLEELARQNQKRAVERELLEDARKKRFTYWKRLCLVARSVMVEFDIPRGFTWGAALEQLDNAECALIIWFRDNRNHKASVGMKITGEPKYDLNWLDRRIFDTLDQMDRIEDSYVAKTQSGILLPT